MIRGQINKIEPIEPMETYTGETIEEMLFRIMENGEPIEATTPIIHTERKDGVNPLYDIRSDRFDLALEATTKIEQALRAKRASYMANENDNNEKGGTDEEMG